MVVVNRETFLKSLMKENEAVRNEVAWVSKQVSCTQFALFQAKRGLLPGSSENLATAVFFKKMVAVSQKLPFVSIAKEYTEDFDSPP